MAKGEAGRAVVGGAWVARASVWVVLALGSATLFGCDDPLPGFANPPDYDAGNSDAAIDDDDAG